mgnify:CR=1 FL=1
MWPPYHPTQFPIMQFRILTLAGLLCLSALLFFCKKDASPIEESPFFDFFNESSIIIDTVEWTTDAWEYGFAFTPLKSGKITQFGIKLPATGFFTVTLWDISGPSPVLLRSSTVKSAALHQNGAADIPDVSLEGGKKYGITVLSNAFYRISKPGNAEFDFPKTVGNIRIESFNETINNTSLATFPTTTNDTRVTPCVNVIFIAD